MLYIIVNKCFYYIAINIIICNVFLSANLNIKSHTFLILFCMLNIVHLQFSTLMMCYYSDQINRTDCSSSTLKYE